MLSSQSAVSAISISELAMASMAAKVLPLVVRALDDRLSQGAVAFDRKLDAEEMTIFRDSWTRAGAHAFHEGGDVCANTARLPHDLGCIAGAHGPALTQTMLHPRHLLVLLEQLLGASTMRDSEVTKAIAKGTGKRVQRLEQLLQQAQTKLAKK